MAPMSRGSGHSAAKVFKQKKNPLEGKVDLDVNRHRFQTFSSRIAGLKIDPVRQRREIYALEDESSYFKSALNEWKDLNMSGNFTEFAQQVHPFCQSLPQILHHETDISILLLKYLNKQDALSLEPLLSLTTHFAHDVGIRFEPFFKDTVATICQIAANHQDVEVIEWSFDCLAWLFKYLSRVLVSDLRPLYDLLSPILGKEHQKAFVTRFAAEAMSFLVRKAGALYEKDRKPLAALIKHALSDVEASSSGKASQLPEGLMVLFAESIKGVNHGLTSCAPAILKALLDRLFDEGTISGSPQVSVQLVVESVMINTIHHANAETFAPLCEVLLQQSFVDSEVLNTMKLKTMARLLFVMIGTRNGSRVKDWPPITQKLQDCLEAMNAKDVEIEKSTADAVVYSLATMFTAAPFNLIIQASETLLSKLNGHMLQPSFLAFCSIVGELDQTRFQSLLLPHLQTFITKHWKEYEEQLALLLPRFSTLITQPETSIQLSKPWQKHILSEIQSLAGAPTFDSDTSGRQLRMYNRYLDLLAVKGYCSEFHDRILAEVVKMVRNEFKSLGNENARFHAFIVRKAFHVAASYIEDKEILIQVWLDATKASFDNHRSPLFLEAVCHVLEKSTPGSIPKPQDDFVASIVENLASPSHRLRLQSLRVLESMFMSTKGQVPDILKIALSIQDSPFDVENSRFLTMNVRKLAQKFEGASSDPWIRLSVPIFCFGLLHIRFSPLWDDVCNAMRTMSKTEGVEDIIVQRALAWVEQDSSSDMEVLSDHEPKSQTKTIMSEFECSNLLKIQTLISRTSEEIDAAPSKLENYLRNDIATDPLLSNLNRSQALRVLNALPQLAEKKSRHLVHILLNWAQTEDSSGLQNNTLTNGDSEPKQSSGWLRKDQKALLELFAQFTNPSVLFRAKDVRDALLVLLTNGDADIQKSALKALFTYKTPSIRPYQDNLLNIMDDARFRDEIAIFINTDDQSSKIQPEHRAELIPVLLRLLYGRIITRAGASSNHGGQESKRRAVLAGLARFGQKDLGEFISIALGPLNQCNVILASGQPNRNLLAQDLMQPRRQLGLLKMIQDIFTTLANLLHPFSGRLANAILYCAVFANRHLEESNLASSEDSESHKSITLLKSIRQEALVCINDLFSTFTELDWKPFMSIIMDSAVNPRLEKFSTENTQSISILLKLFSTWSESISTLPHLLSQEALLESVSQCLANVSTKDQVKLFIMNSVIRNLLNSASDEDVMDVDDSTIHQDLKDRLSHTLGSSLLRSVSIVLHQSQSQEIIEASVSIILGVAPFSSGSAEISALLESTVYLLTQPSKRISPRLKGEVLKVIEQLVPRLASTALNEQFESIFKVSSSLFGFFKDGPNRRRLVQILYGCARHEPALQAVAELCDKLNSFSSSQLDLPDFEKRQLAFHSINDEKTGPLTLKEWRPILYNMLFFIKDNEEFVIRTSASLSLRGFVKAASLEDEKAQGLKTFAMDALVPALQKGMSDASELVRTEYVSILAEIVKNGWDELDDMKGLMGSDEESSFFNNILHIQMHRRIRALRKLAQEASSISSDNIAKFCMPLAEDFLSEADEGTGNLVAEAINAIGVLTEHLQWSRARVVLQKRISETAKFDSKFQIKALAAVVDGLSQAQAARTQVNGEDTLLPALARTLPPQTQLSLNISRTILPKLTEYVHFKDESSVNLRVLVAPIIVKLIMIMSDADIAEKLPPLLMDMCNILKSKAQDARDTVRKTLADICATIGPRYFSFVLKQLRSSLQRGAHLHVLTYTVHSILVSVSPKFKPGEIDYCLGDLLNVVLDDIFGATGQEKDAKDYVSKMREVRKKNLSYDSMELIATFTSLSRISDLVKPLQSQLEKPRAKVDKADELLRRLREGLRRNPQINDRQSLTLCYEIIKGSYESAEGQMRLKAHYSYKLAAFAFDLLRRVLDKYETLKTSENLAGFMPLLDLSMQQGEEELQIASSRLFSSIIKIPLDEIDNKASIYIRQAKHIIEDAPSTNTPLAQTALRLISSILRERPNAPIEQDRFEMDIAYLLARIRPDLHDPARQGDRECQVAAFNFLKAVLGRGVLLKEIYEIMDTVREIMVTNSEHPIPDLARSVYSRFVLDYFPDEGKGLRKQVDFLVSNLQYPHARGRLSVIEVMHFLLSKKDDNSVQALLTALFIPLLLILVADESEECRQSAQLLLRKVFERASKENMKLFKIQFRKWLEPSTDILWQRVAVQCWKAYFEIHNLDAKDGSFVFEQASQIIRNATEQDLDADRLLFDTMNLFQKLCELFPGLTYATESSSLWVSIFSKLESTSQHIISSSAKLTGLLLSHLTKGIKAATGVEHEDILRLPLTGKHGFELDSKKAMQMVECCTAAIETALNEQTISQLIQNVAFIGRCCQTSEEGQDILDTILADAAALIRKETDENGLRGRLAALQLTAALCKFIPAKAIQPSLEDILMPLHNLTDSSIPTPSYADHRATSLQEELVSGARELLSQLQTKFGTSDFVSQMQQVEKEVRERREERRAKRRIEVVSAPEKAGREKQRRHLVKRDKRKEKNSRHAGLRRGW